MAIATKTGSFIVKDGRLAESCACCGISCAAGSPYYTMSASLTISNVRPDLPGASKLNPSIDWLDLRNPSSFQPDAGKVITMPLVLWRDWGAKSNGTQGPSSFSYNVLRGFDASDGLPIDVMYTVSNQYEAPGGQCYFRYNSTRPGTVYLIRKQTGNIGYACPGFEAFFLPALDGLTIGISGYLTGFCNFWPRVTTPYNPPLAFHARENNERTAGGFMFNSSFSFSGVSVSQTFTNLSAQNVFASSVAGTTYNWLYDITLSLVT